MVKKKIKNRKKKTASGGLAKGPLSQMLGLFKSKVSFKKKK